MKLLSQEQTKSIKDSSFSEQAGRVKKLQEAENTSVRRLNDALGKEKEERARIEKDIAEATAEYEAALTDLQKEVSSLEKRKAEALAPTYEREKAVTEAEEILKQKEEIFYTKAEALELKLAEAIGMRGDYERALKKLEEYRADIDARAKKVVTDQAESERLISARESRFNDEKARLRTYFEKEDAKLTEKIKILRDLEKNHG